MVLELYSRAVPHNLLWLWVSVVLVHFLEQLLELTDFVLKVDNIVPWYLCTLRLVKVFAMGVCPFAWPTPW